MLQVESDSSKKSICLTQKTEKEDVVFLGGGVEFITMMVVVGTAPPTPPVLMRQPSSLSRGVDVQLTLQDVVDDRLTQVVHDVTVTVLQGQSEDEDEERQWSSLNIQPSKLITVLQLACFLQTATSISQQT